MVPGQAPGVEVVAGVDMVVVAEPTGLVAVEQMEVAWADAAGSVALEQMEVAWADAAGSVALEQMVILAARAALKMIQISWIRSPSCTT